MKDNRSYYGSWLFWTLFLGIYLCVFAAIPLVVGWQERAGHEELVHRYDDLTLEGLSQLSQMRFPSDAKLLRHQVSYGIMGYEVYAVVGMDRKSVTAFVQSLKQAREDVNVGSGAVTSGSDRSVGSGPSVYGRPEWWPSHFAERPITVSRDRNGKLQNLLIDLDRRNTATVYIHLRD